MTIVTDIIIIVILFGLFGLIHSIMAADFVKHRLVNKIGSQIAWYRLFFNIVSVITFVAAWYLSPKPYILIYELQYPWDIVMVGVQIIAVIGAVYAFRFFDGLEFLGFRQVLRKERGNYDQSELDEHYTLEINGPYKYMRHPIYFFSIMYLVARPVLYLFDLIFVICLIIYFFIGAFFEEKKLVARFGVKYIDYKKNVPAIFPIKLFR